MRPDRGHRHDDGGHPADDIEQATVGPLTHRRAVVRDEHHEDEQRRRDQTVEDGALGDRGLLHHPLDRFLRDHDPRALYPAVIGLVDRLFRRVAVMEPPTD